MSKCEISGWGIHLKVADVERSGKFYESLGFEAVFAWGDDAFRESLPKGLQSAPERCRAMLFKLGDNAELEIAEGHIGFPDKKIFQERIKGPKASPMIHVKSLLPLFTNPLVEIKSPVRYYYWDTIEVVFQDPDGLFLIFIAPYSDEEFSRVSQLTSIEVIKAGGS